MADYKVAVVAGVGSGIGARFVETFAQADYRVVALARNAESLEQIRAGLGARAERCVFWATDITDPDQVKKAFLRVRNEFILLTSGAARQTGESPRDADELSAVLTISHRT